MPIGREADYCRRMHRAPRALSALIVALALALVGATALPAGAAEPSVTERIFGDYVADRVIDGDYTAAELGAALDVAEGDEAFSEFASAVQETYDRDILGLSTDGGPAEVAAADSGGLSLPQPRGPGERDQPPWPFLALTALAGALVVTGAGSSILRRARR